MKFIQDIWKLTPQPVKLEFEERVNQLIKEGKFNEVKKEYFQEFEKGKHVTWQQYLILKAVEKGLAKQAPLKISVVSGHGIGKDATLSWLILWYLFCHLNAQVGATAPTSDLLSDVLWKEIRIWLDKMPKEISDLYEWQADYIRIKEKRETWFARARTAKKETPEAIAGLHGDYVMIAVDEASGVFEEVYKSAGGSLTGENTLVILIGNGIRNLGYFYNTHHDSSDLWQTLQFDSEDSPIVDLKYIEDIENQYGRESDEFKIRVKGKFPTSEQMDESGWIPLVTDRDIRQVSENIPFIGRKYMGIDPSGEGDDTTRWVIRDRFQAKVVATENISNDKSIARKTYDLIKQFELDPKDITIGNFGVGADVKAELMLLDHKMQINTVNEGEKPNDTTRFLNVRMELAQRGRDWLVRGGALVGDEFKRDVLGYFYKHNINGKKQLMDKPNLKKRLGRSPDRGDAFLLSFYTDDSLDLHSYETVIEQPVVIQQQDIFSAI